MIKLIQGNCEHELKKLKSNSVDGIVTDPPYGWSFMGKKWDYSVPKVSVFKEMLRVLKPWGHILCACGTRTQHRMACNIEDAGFEIRDVISWLYGSGFPKSLNVGKAVDKLQGNEREVVGVAKGAGKNPQGYDKRPNNGKYNSEYPETKGNSPFEGWGTALKPAQEFFTLARKPLSEKTVAENVLKWGTGAINIDACRVETSEKIYFNREKNKTTDSGWEDVNRSEYQQHNQGRFPANVIHDGSEEIVALFPDTKSGGGNKSNRNSKSNFGGGAKYDDIRNSDQGSASRFFYCAKASKSERNKGLEGFEEKARPTMGSGIGGQPDQQRANNKNTHPTVKPIKLMSYLCKLITPVGGTVLDPYMGSGSTGVASKKENFNFVGIELNEEYYKIAKARIEND